MVLLLSFSLVPSGAGSDRAGGIVILLSAKTDVYREAVRGIEQVLQHEIVAEYDMRGDFERGRRLLGQIQSQEKPELLIAVGVWALELVVQEPPDIPVVYTMVLNPPTVVGDAPRNITGASINVPVESAIRTITQLGPEIHRVGAIFNPANTGYLIADATRIALTEGLELVARKARSVGEAVAALDFLHQEGIDALWIVPDETILAPAVVEHMLLFSYRNKVPLLGLSRRHAEMGALLSLSFASSEDIGRQAGELANRTLAAKSRSAIPFTMARMLDLTVNLKTARKLGIEVPQSVVDAAHEVIR